MHHRHLPKPRDTTSSDGEKLSSKEIVRQQRIEDAERRQRVLEAQRRQRVLEKIKAQRLDVAYEHGRKQCLTFCAKFHAALPRELRDMVYDQLITPGLRHHVMEALDEKGQPRVSSNPLVSVSFFDPRSRIPKQVSVRRDIWKYREYMGDIVAKEVAERWYHTGLFILDAEDLIIPKFLSTDVWEQDNVPADAVRHLRINIHHPEYYTEQLFEQIQENLKHLSKILNKKTEIIFYISWLQSNYYAGSRIGQIYRPLVPLLWALAQTVCGLLEQGFKGVKVQQSSNGACRKDVTDLFKGSPNVFEGLPRLNSEEYEKKIEHIVDLLLVRNVN